MVDGDHRVIAHNRKSIDMVGLDPEYLDTKPLWADTMRKAAEIGWFGPEVDVEELIKTQPGIRAKPGPPIIRQHRRPDGAEFEIWSKSLAGGGWVQSITDVTEINRAQEEVANARDMLRDAIESIPDGFIILDDEDRLVISNQPYSDIFSKISHLLVPGVKYEEIADATLESGLFRDEDDQGAMRQRLIDQHHNPTGETVLRKLQDGRWIQFKDRKTSSGGLVGLRTDVTEIKSAEEELARNKEILETTINSVDQAITMVDRDHKLIAYNQSWAEMVGLDTEYLDTRPIWFDVVRKFVGSGWFGPDVDIDEIVRLHKRERTKAGMDAAQPRGKHVGRPPALTDEQIAFARRTIAAGDDTQGGMAAVLGVRNTLKRALQNGAEV